MNEIGTFYTKELFLSIIGPGWHDRILYIYKQAHEAWNTARTGYMGEDLTVYYDKATNNLEVRRTPGSEIILCFNSDETDEIIKELTDRMQLE